MKSLEIDYFRPIRIMAKSYAQSAREEEINFNEGVDYFLDVYNNTKNKSIAVAAAINYMIIERDKSLKEQKQLIF